MKKALIIANMLFASATVFGIWPPRERENFRPEGVNLFAELTERRPSVSSERLTELFYLLIVRDHYDAERHSLNLSNQNLTFLPLAIREMENLEELNLSNNRVEYFFSLPDSIRKLNISKNNFSHVPFGIFGLRWLEELDLSNNNLTSLCRNEILDFLPRSIKKLNISGNDLKSLGSLLSFPDLEELTLDGWLLKYIPDDRIEFITNIHGVNEGRLDPEYFAMLIVNEKNNLYSGNKLLLQALGGVCTVRLKRHQSDVN